MSNILLKTKLHVPQTRTVRVRRPALVMRLQQSMDKKLILISAPAGYGKTTLIVEWLATVHDPPAWITLDKRDNDIGTFWSYLTHALQMVCPPLKNALTYDLLPSNYLMFETYLIDLINELDQRHQSIILVLDEYQVIQSQDIHQGIAYLIDHAPVCFHLVIVTRADPPLNLAQLRGRSQLAELRLADLRFSHQEIMDFMKTVMQVELSEREISSLAATTEGWIAGLQLAGLSLQGKENPTAFIENFSGDDRYVMDFLFEEVLNLQPELIQDFLLQTAPLDRLCASLCNAVMQDTHSQAILDVLEKNNLFLIALDDQRIWYRYHHLFRDLLRNRLHRTPNIDLKRLHQHACSWYEAEGELEIAISHALNAGDYVRMADLLEKFSQTIDLQNQQLMFTNWLEILPDEVIGQHPWLCVLRGWGAYWTGHRGSDQERWLVLAENALEQDENPARKQKIQGYIAVIRAHIALAHSEIPRVMDQGHQALDLLPENDPMRCEATIALAGAYWAQGDVIQTKKMFVLTRDTATRTNYLSMAAGSSVYLGIQQVKQGLLTDAIGSFTEGVRLATLPSGRETPMVGIANCRLGDVWREQNKLNAAVDVLRRGLIQCQILGQPDFLTDAYLCDARYHLAMGDLAAAHDSLDHVESIIKQTIVDPWIYCWLDECRLKVWLTEGSLDAINLWVYSSGLSPEDPLDYHKDLHHQNLARVLVARHLFEGLEKDYQDANKLLNRLQTAAKRAGWVHEEIKVLTLKAINFRSKGLLDHALQTLLDAIFLAQPGGYVRVFLDEGKNLCDLFKSLDDLSEDSLAELLNTNLIKVDISTPVKIKNTISKIYAAFIQPSNGALVEQEDRLTSPRFLLEKLYEPPGERLTPREIEVLHLLTKGYPDKKIAETLVITRETVHKHLKNIYQKLDVHSRTEAVIRAQALGWLGDQ
jgi:LuxR family transcriptional regulator, maltose regulon positive regulatory protein